MSDQLIGVLQGSLMIGALLVIGALIDVFRKKMWPGPRQPKKLTRREIFWVIIIVMLLVLLGMPLGVYRHARVNRPITISDR